MYRSSPRQHPAGLRLEILAGGHGHRLLDDVDPVRPVGGGLEERPPAHALVPTGAPTRLGSRRRSGPLASSNHPVTYWEVYNEPGLVRLLRAGRIPERDAGGAAPAVSGDVQRHPGSRPERRHRRAQHRQVRHQAAGRPTTRPPTEPDINTFLQFCAPAPPSGWPPLPCTTTTRRPARSTTTSGTHATR